MSALTLNEEQLLLKESVERFVERDYGFEARNRLLGTEARLSREHWRRFAELGWLAVAIPEAYGGLGGGPVEEAVVCEAFGRGLVLEPYVSTAVLGVKAALLADDEERRRSLLEDVARGERLLALAVAERGGRFDLGRVDTRARPEGNAFSLTGEKIAVLDAPSADTLIVPARLEGGPGAEAGIALFLVEPGTPGLQASAYPTMDGARAADLCLDGARGEMLVGAERGLSVLAAAVEDATVARCAYAAGGMAAAFEQTLEYVKTRRQFGVPIGSFQVLQHRLVDILMAVRECQSMTLLAAGELTGDDPGERAKAVSAAKTFIGKRARAVAQEIVQMHGGIGMTEELSIGHFFRSLTLFTSVYGSTDHHLARYARLAQDE